MNRGGRVGLMATLTALSPGWAAAVAAGLPGLVIFVVFLSHGFRFALACASVFSVFVATVTLASARRGLARSPHLRRLPFRDRRAVMASILHGGENVDPTLAPAIEEQAARLVGGQRSARRAWSCFRWHAA